MAPEAADHAKQIQALKRELAFAQKALTERRVVDRAKCHLMERHGLSEANAYARLREQAMQQRRELADVARELVQTAA